MLGTFSIHNKRAVILFDFGASHNFISAKFGARMEFNFNHTKRVILAKRPIIGCVPRRGGMKARGGMSPTKLKRDRKDADALHMSK